jgi:hypothetical protein
MTPMETLSALCRFLETTLRDFRFVDEMAQEREITVYPFHLPQPPATPMNPRAPDGHTPVPSDQEPEAWEPLMPAVVVRPLKYENKVFEDGSALMTVAITAGVFSRDPDNVKGSWGVVNILERIRQALETTRILDERCEIMEPLSWELYDEALRPLWFGEMIAQWRIITPERSYEEDWLGDFLHRNGD